MAEYIAPIKEMQFVLKHVVGLDQVNRLPGWEEVTEDVVDAILEQAGKLAHDVISPLNVIGDRQGAKWKDGAVTTPPGFKEAYSQYVNAGWGNILGPTQFGGQGLPASSRIASTTSSVTSSHPGSVLTWSSPTTCLRTNCMSLMGATYSAMSHAPLGRTTALSADEHRQTRMF